MKKLNIMKNILFTLAVLISFGSYSQSKADNINAMVKGARTTIGTVDELNGIVMQNIFNESNEAIVYEIKLTKKETADIFRNYQSKEQLILQDKQLGKKGVSAFVIKHNIVVKYRYYYNNSIIKSLTVMPNEWNN